MQDHSAQPQHNPSQSTPPDSWERDTLREALLESYKEQRSRRRWRNFWRIVWVVLFLLFLVSLTGRNDAHIPHGEHTAVINLKGEIGGNPYEDQIATLRESLTTAYENPDVKGIILRADSPGGSPVVSNILFEEIRTLKQQHPDTPLYVVTEDVCASGCYYIASAADKIYADPSSIVGSIGVIGGGFDVTGLMDKLGVKRRLKIAGSNKGMGDPFSPETPEQTAIWNKMLQDIHNNFITAVKTGRGKAIDEKKNPDIFSGRIYTGKEAKEVGLIDGYGNIYSIARDEFQAPELINYSPEEGLFSTLTRRIGSAMISVFQEQSHKIW